MEDQVFEFDDATVTVPSPEGAQFSDLDGLPAGDRHLTWTAAPGAFFMVSAGPGAGYTPEGMLNGEDLSVDSDAAAPLAGPDARRVAFRETKHRSRRLEPGHRVVPERTVRQLSDLLFVPGEHQHLRVGYRVEEDAPEELRTLLARMLDGVEVRRRDA